MKKYFVSILMILVTFVFAGCSTKERANLSDYVDLPPETKVSNSIKGLDFVELHNCVLESTMEDMTPFFFVKKNCFDIDGSNDDPKRISLVVDCIDGTTEKDAELFISYVLTSIGDFASEQNYKYSRCSQDNDGTYTDFGGVFNEYALVLKVTADGRKPEDQKVVLYDLTVNPGEKIPIDPRIWSN